MTWMEVKDKIENRLNEIWLNEPEAMWKTRHGISVAGAGSFNQHLSTQMFVDVYTIAYGQHMFFMFIQFCDDPDMPLELLKKMTKNELTFGFKSMEFLAYVSTPEVWDFAQDIAKVLPQIQTKDEYRELMGAYVRFINQIQMWFHTTFPWHIGLMYQYKTAAEIEKMHLLSRE